MHTSRGREESEGWTQHGVASLDAERLQRKNDRIRSVGTTNRMLGPTVLRRLDLEEGVVARMGGEPEHELVEEEDEAVVAEIAGMAGEDRQAVVDADIFGEHLPRRGVVFAEPAGQRDVFGGGRHGSRCRVESFRGPFGC